MSPLEQPRASNRQEVMVLSPSSQQPIRMPEMFGQLSFTGLEQEHHFMRRQPQIFNAFLATGEDIVASGPSTPSKRPLSPPLQETPSTKRKRTSPATRTHNRLPPKGPTIRVSSVSSSRRTAPPSLQRQKRPTPLDIPRSSAHESRKLPNRASGGPATAPPAASSAPTHRATSPGDPRSQQRGAASSPKLGSGSPHDGSAVTDSPVEISEVGLTHVLTLSSIDERATYRALQDLLRLSRELGKQARSQPKSAYSPSSPGDDDDQPPRLFHLKQVQRVLATLDPADLDLKTKEEAIDKDKHDLERWQQQDPRSRDAMGVTYQEKVRTLRAALASREKDLEESEARRKRIFKTEEHVERCTKWLVDMKKHVNIQVEFEPRAEAMPFLSGEKAREGKVEVVAV